MEQGDRRAEPEAERLASRAPGSSQEPPVADLRRVTAATWVYPRWVHPKWVYPQWVYPGRVHPR